MPGVKSSSAFCHTPYLAHMGAGRVATGAKVQRRDQRCRYPSGEGDLAKLKELGLV